MTWEQWLALLSGLVAFIQGVIWTRHIPKGIRNFRRWKAELLLTSFYKVILVYSDSGNLLRGLVSWAFNLTVALTAGIVKRALPDHTHSQWLWLADLVLLMTMVNRLTIVLVEGYFLKPGLEDFEAFSSRVRQALTKSAPEKLDKFENWYSRIKDKIQAVESSSTLSLSSRVPHTEISDHPVHFQRGITGSRPFLEAHAALIPDERAAGFIRAMVANVRMRRRKLRCS